MAIPTRPTLAGAAGTTGTSSEMIDKLDDNDARIMMVGGRQGPWHSFNDSNGGNQQPPIGTGFLPVPGGANSTSHAVHTTGSGYQFGGVGFDLNNSTTMPESPIMHGGRSIAATPLSIEMSPSPLTLIVTSASVIST